MKYLHTKLPSFLNDQILEILYKFQVLDLALTEWGEGEEK